MTEVYGVLVGSWPRSEALIKSFREYSKGKLSSEELRNRIVEASRKVIRVQAEAGLRYQVDGMLGWHDLLRPIAEKLEGIEVDGLARWFDNNTFYKKPIITGEVSRREKLLSGYIFPELAAEGRWKLVLPDPYTFISLSENRGRLKFEELLFQVAEAIGEEIRELEAAHRIGQVQLSAPSLVWRKLDSDMLDIIGDAIEVAFRGVRAEKMIHLYFGDGVNALPQVLDYDADVIGFDMTSTNLRELMEYSIEGIGLGFIDGRNSLMERADLVARRIREYLERYEPKTLYITPSCDLEFLPPEIAEQKVRLLRRILEMMGEEE